MEQLNKLYYDNLRQKYPTMPEAYLPPPKYTDKTANGLTKCIIDFITFSGYQAERISSQGQYRDGRKTVTDVLGGVRTIGSGVWTPGAATKGTADISATIRGRSVKIEVKMRDKQSEAQKFYQCAIENAGGIYWLVRSFNEFIALYNNAVRTDGIHG